MGSRASPAFFPSSHELGPKVKRFGGGVSLHCLGGNFLGLLGSSFESCGHSDPNQFRSLNPNQGTLSHRCFCAISKNQAVWENQVECSSVGISRTC